MFFSLLGPLQVVDGDRNIALGAPKHRALLALLLLRRGEPVSAESLAEARMAALETRIDADLALGREDELVPELQALVREYPLRERLRGQLMLALYRAGRQAEALDVYREGRRRLVEELGIEPSRALQDLERAILAHDDSIRLQ